MKTKMPRLAAIPSAATMIIGLSSGCTGGESSGSSGESSGSAEIKSTTASEAVSDLKGVEISILNSKGEIQTALEEMAEAFETETGIKVDVVACLTGEVPYTKITSAYNSGTAPTMAMLDTTDVVGLASEYALDLSDERWVSEAGENLVKLDNSVYGFPFCVEGRGLIYNKTTIKAVLGVDFDPTTINSYSALKSLLESLRAKGMENPVVVSKEDWSLAAHQLGFIYDTYDGTTAGSAELINKLKSGELNPADYERTTQFLDTLDLLLEYNVNKADPLGALYEQDPIFLADGEAALWANGCWAWPNLADAGAETSDEYGFIPFVLGKDTGDFANTGIEAAPTKYIMIDRVQSTEDQQKAAKEFLNWLVYNESG